LENKIKGGNVMKKLLLIMVLLVILTITVGCGEIKEETESKDLKVALVLTGAKNDNGWSQLGYNGLLDIEKEYGAEIAFNENTQTAQYTQVIKTYAKDGYNVIIAHGIQMLDSVKEVALEYPDVQFFINSSDITTNVTNGKNISSIIANGLEQGFIQGVAAAYMAQNKNSKIVGAVSGVEIPAMKITVDGFELGVKYIDPSIKVIKAFTGSFDDVNKLKEQAITFIQQGASIIMSTANAATRGGFEATKEKGGISIGAQSSSLLGEYKDNLALTVNSSISKAMVTTIGYLVEGNFKADNYISGIKEGVIVLDISKTQPDVQLVKSKIEAIFKDVESGKIDVMKIQNK
jgi:basic membrane protein A and related proteins